MVAEAVAMETWRALTFNLPSSSLFEYTPTNIPTRAASKGELRVPKINFANRDWFIYKALRLWNWLAEKGKKTTWCHICKKGNQITSENIKLPMMNPITLEMISLLYNVHLMLKSSQELEIQIIFIMLN